MNKYIPNFDQALEVLLSRPQNEIHLSAALGLGLLLTFYVFKKSLSSMGKCDASFPTVLICTMVGGVVMAVGSALSLTYLKGAMGSTALVYLGLCIASFVVVGPLLSLILKNGYASVLGSWILAVLSCVVLMLALSGIFEAISSSDSITDSQNRRNAELDGLINR